MKLEDLPLAVAKISFAQTLSVTEAARAARRACDDYTYIARWYGRGGGPTQRIWIDYLADAVDDEYYVIATESARWKSTKPTKDAISRREAYWIKRLTDN